MGELEGHGAQRETAVTLKPDLFCPAQLPAVIQGKTVMLGREGTSIELSCKSSQQKSTFFIWKLPNQTRVLGMQNNFLIRGRIPLVPHPGRKTVSSMNLLLEICSWEVQCPMVARVDKNLSGPLSWDFLSPAVDGKWLLVESFYCCSFNIDDFNGHWKSHHIKYMISRLLLLQTSKMIWYFVYSH